jgi:hypothetical protein
MRTQAVRRARIGLVCFLVAAASLVACAVEPAATAQEVDVDVDEDATEMLGGTSGVTPALPAWNHPYQPADPRFWSVVDNWFRDARGTTVVSSRDFATAVARACGVSVAAANAAIHACKSENGLAPNQNMKIRDGNFVDSNNGTDLGPMMDYMR